MQRVLFTTSLDFSLLTRLVTDAAAAGRNVEEHVERILAQAVPSPKPTRMSAEETVTLALTRAEARPEGDEFELEGLFKPGEWALVDKPKVCGRLFRSRAEARGIVVLIRRTISRHAVYQRTSVKHPHG